MQIKLLQSLVISGLLIGQFAASPSHAEMKTRVVSINEVGAFDRLVLKNEPGEPVTRSSTVRFLTRNTGLLEFRAPSSRIQVGGEVGFVGYTELDDRDTTFLRPRAEYIWKASKVTAFSARISGELRTRDSERHGEKYRTDGFAHHKVLDGTIRLFLNGYFEDNNFNDKEFGSGFDYTEVGTRFRVNYHPENNRNYIGVSTFGSKRDSDDDSLDLTRYGAKLATGWDVSKSNRIKGNALWLHTDYGPGSLPSDLSNQRSDDLYRIGVGIDHSLTEVIDLSLGVSYDIRESDLQTFDYSAPWATLGFRANF